MSGNTFNSNTIICHGFKEIIPKKIGKVIITYISPTQLKWDLKWTGIGGRGINFKVPKNVTLTKLNVNPPAGSFGK